MLLPAKTGYDGLCKEILKVGEGPLVLWFADYKPDQMEHVRFLPTELKLLGVVTRICDAIASLKDLKDGSRPVAGLMEFQTDPDMDILDRVGLAGHLFRLSGKPSDLPADRWNVLFVVVNLTGTARHALHLAHHGSRWEIVPRQKNLAECEANTIVEQIARKEIPDEVAAFVSLMKNGGNPDIIQRWKDVTLGFNPHRRRELAAANVVFAELTQCQEVWRSVTEDFKVADSTFLASIKADGVNTGQANAVIQVLKKRGAVPADLETAIRSCTDKGKLEHWLDLAFEHPSIAEFRKQAGI